MRLINVDLLDHLVRKSCALVYALRNATRLVLKGIWKEFNGYIEGFVYMFPWNSIVRDRWPRMLVKEMKLFTRPPLGSRICGVNRWLKSEEGKDGVRVEWGLCAYGDLKVELF